MMKADKRDLEFEREIKVATELARSAGAILLEHYYSPFLVEQKVNARTNSKK